MGNIGYYKPGDNNAVCDRCGRPFKASMLKKTWDGLWVCQRDWEPRHPQDFVKSVKDDQTVKISRPWTDPVFVDEAAALPMPPNPLGV
jgi:hypothetical protein